LNQKEVIKLAKKAGYKVKKVEPLTQDASQRQYFRIYTSLEVDTPHDDDELNPTIFIFCYLDPKLGSQEKFVEINKSLNEYEYSNLAPKIFFQEKNLGITIQENIGDEGIDLYDLYDRFGPPGSEFFHEKSFYGAFYMALELLNDMQSKKIPNIHKLKKNELINQMKTFESVYLSNFLCISPFEIAAQSKNIKKLIKETIKKLDSQPWVNCHTDFEGRNILMTPNFDWDYMYLIDYQDMCIGPAGIDLAGIIFDHYLYRNFDIGKIKNEIAKSSIVLSTEMPFRFEETIEERGRKLVADEIFEYARWGAIQRNMRILGTLSNLYLQQKRSFRLPDLELILLNLNSAIPEDYVELKSFIMDSVFSANAKRIDEIL
jgi:aminoglycoside/choline kinase family phosphotransferase